MAPRHVIIGWRDWDLVVRSDFYSPSEGVTFFHSAAKSTMLREKNPSERSEWCIICPVDARLDPLPPQEQRHPAFRPREGTPQRDQWERERYSVRKQVREEELRGPVVRVAGEEARTALALVLSQSEDGLLEVPDIHHAHRVIYTRIEQCWVDASNGEYIVTQARLAVLKLMSEVVGLNAALKASKQKLTNRVNSDDAIEHMKRLGVVKVAEPDTSEMPRRSVELERDPPSPEKPPSGR